MSKIAYANFLITGPDGYATNAETAREALDLLADAIDNFARNLEMWRLAGDPEVIRRDMDARAKRVRATNPTAARFPKRYRFRNGAFEYFDFAAERNLPHEEN